MNKGFFFDRDGIINKLVKDKNILRPPHNLSELKLNYEIFDSIKFLKNRFKVFVVSNQPDVARGKLKLNELEIINKKINNELKFLEIVCETEDNSLHKKPSPYMLNQLIKKYDIEKSSSWILGDRWVDIEAGFHAGINTILLKNDYSFEDTSAGSHSKKIKPDVVINNLNEFQVLTTKKFQR